MQTNLNSSLPLIRVDDLEYLKSLQEGNVFMRNNLYYQYGDTADSARTDVFDGSLPTFDSVQITAPSGLYTSDARIMLPDCYIKCFTQCRLDDLEYSNNIIHFALKGSAKKVISEMGKKYAIVILAAPFTERFYYACDNQGIACGANPVQ